MNSDTAREAIKKSIGSGWFDLLGPAIYLGDREIPQVSPDEMRVDMADFIPSRGYTKRKHDCDDQTFEELGHMTGKVRKGRGFAWSEPHAFCVFLWKEELWIYDRGTILTYREAMTMDYYGKIYKLKGIRLLPVKYWLKGRFIKRDLLVI